MTFLTVVIPIFATILLGLVSRRTGFIPASAFRGLTDIVVSIMLPAMLFGTIIRSPSFNFLAVAGVYFSACLIVFAAGVLISRLMKQSFAQAALLGLNACYGNTIMLGVPIATAALGTEALPPLLGIVALHSVILLPLAAILVEMDTGGGQRPAIILRNTLLGTLRNPIILSILIAAIWRLLGLPVPLLVGNWLQMLASAAIPLALLCLGGTLPPLNARALGKEVAIATVLKLLVLPLLVWLIGTLASLPPLALAVAVLTAGMPTGANAFLLARRSESLLEISAATVLIATSLSLVTIYALLYLIS